MNGHWWVGIVSFLLVGCSGSPDRPIPTTRAFFPATAATAATASLELAHESDPATPRYEYAEVRWEIGPGTRTVWLERPGDQFKGAWFQDALDYATLARPMPTNTEKATSSDLLTMLNTQGWELVTHAMSHEVGDLHVEVWTLRRDAR
jgi:hypothetical protein